MEGFLFGWITGAEAGNSAGIGAGSITIPLGQDCIVLQLHTPAIMLVPSFVGQHPSLDITLPDSKQLVPITE